MDRLRFDTAVNGGAFKPLNAVNNGPVGKRHDPNQYRSNLATYKAARIPYARPHDAALFSGYGGHHTVDISGIFPDFSADPTDPTSYDFPITDEHLAIMTKAGAEPFYRLGQSIELYIKKYHVAPPADFSKWAVICEHIIRHYTEGWANGFHYHITYWEIWNEPDSWGETSGTWQGTPEQFYDLYVTTATHLKACFPHIKVGGPALAWREDWAEGFLQHVKQAGAPLDFFSWHRYCITPEEMVEKALRIDALLKANGFEKTESILNEWNYVKDWGKDFVKSIETIIGMKGAAFTMGCMAAAQWSPIDMLMYYDARPTTFNGMFDFYTLRPLKGYYPFLWYGLFYDTAYAVPCQTKAENLYPLCGVDENGKVTAVITYYTDEDDAPAKTVTVDFGKTGEFQISLLDETHDGDVVATTADLTFTLAPNSCLLIREQ